MFESNNEYFVVDICDEDMEITEKWLVKVSLIEEDVDYHDMPCNKKGCDLATRQSCCGCPEMINWEKKNRKGEEYISKKLVYELIQRFAPDETLVLGFEVEKLPILYLPEKEKMILKFGEKATINISKLIKYFGKE